ncbi:MAG: hypothetical protein PCALPYG88_5275 [uncultured Paraburkholderia sp.]|nr:MAG: hypothetical protein PCALPYG08_5394 [uncultured Paraburkholderia sp.]CAH2934583.1 MAG: hypothetical protein PCALPYG88_5275 [uncultured Paraburkholderia sp.]
MVASLEFGFLEFAVPRIIAETSETSETSESKAAIRLCKTVGKRVESERVNDRRFKGHECTTTVLAIARNEWGPIGLCSNRTGRTLSPI